MNKIRELIINPIIRELSVETLYEYSSNIGLVWLLEEAVVGKEILGVLQINGFSPHDKSCDFRCAPFVKCYIEDIHMYNEKECLIIRRV